MPRVCTICGHSERETIDQELVNTGSFSLRDIAGRYDVSRSALERHKAAHLPAALAKVKDANDVAAAGRVLNELKKIYDRANKLFDACDRWLQDPENPDQYTLDPRSEDINIVYSWLEEGPKGGMLKVRKKDKLSTLLRQVNDHHGNDLDFELVETKSADPRELVLKAANTLRGILELFQELYDFRDLEGRLAELEKRING